jgi:hypothetical protein
MLLAALVLLRGIAVACNDFMKFVFALSLRCGARGSAVG